MDKENKNIFYNMNLKDLFSENFLRLYVNRNKISSFNKLDILDKSVSELKEEEIKTIENLLGFRFEFLKNRAINYIIIKNMNDLDIL